MPEFNKAVEIATHGKTDNQILTDNGTPRKPRGRARSGPLYEPIRVAEDKKMPRHKRIKRSTRTGGS